MKRPEDFPLKMTFLISYEAFKVLQCTRVFSFSWNKLCIAKDSRTSKKIQVIFSQEVTLCMKGLSLSHSLFSSNNGCQNYSVIQKNPPCPISGVLLFLPLFFARSIWHPSFFLADIISAAKKSIIFVLILSKLARSFWGQHTNPFFWVRCEGNQMCLSTSQTLSYELWVRLISYLTCVCTVQRSHLNLEATN